MRQMTQEEARHYPKYRFALDADELRAMHERLSETITLKVERNTCLPWSEDRFVKARVYKEYRQYIVDHGAFKTLNTIIPGELVPRMEDLEIVK